MTLLIMILIGGVIGYITNMLAIKLLFRPLAPVTVFGKRMPFTPGVVHRRKEEIAVRLGEIVRDELLKPEKIQLLMRNRIKKFMENHHVKDKSLLGFFTTISDKVLDTALINLPVAGLVSSEIRDFDVQNIEKMAIRAAGIELKYIEILGGVLGACIGAAQYFIITYFIY